MFSQVPWFVIVVSFQVDMVCDKGTTDLLRGSFSLCIKKMPSSGFVQEYDLEQKIDLEIKMREGTTKLLAVCQHRPQSLEAAKSLLTSNERMAAYVAELQRRKTAERPKQS